MHFYCQQFVIVYSHILLLCSFWFSSQQHILDGKRSHRIAYFRPFLRGVALASSKPSYVPITAVDTLFDDMHPDVTSKGLLPGKSGWSLHQDIQRMGLPRVIAVGSSLSRLIWKVLNGAALEANIISFLGHQFQRTDPVTEIVRSYNEVLELSCVCKRLHLNVFPSYAIFALLRIIWSHHDFFVMRNLLN
jgi:hypothetical protein